MARIALTLERRSPSFALSLCAQAAHVQAGLAAIALASAALRSMASAMSWSSASANRPLAGASFRPSRRARGLRVFTGEMHGHFTRARMSRFASTLAQRRAASMLSSSSRSTAPVQKHGSLRLRL
eukprot:CAMPEP_0168363010 /NCGR_PEP_ID=MMETSP0228-20121227/3473_1 /TAXON_ID=133427 /ORGANISM="Protoceratium reticulatum, Strain CCCM 535 (=CCMP 1889)" /LENGTH=124 /DNA_ID=CAMNT_0008375729 /DNA_START=302 /DNA_END=672 /DNA_ORIENTATION=+